MKRISVGLIIIGMAVLSACGGENTSSSSKADKKVETEEKEKEVPASIKEGKGVGAIENVELTEELDKNLYQEGEAIYDMKCASCHKLGDQRVVGPGFAGITNRRKPEWILNMITNTDVMLSEDPTAQALLEECLTRMPNQNVSTEDARKILEFFRKNDMDEVGSKDGALQS